MKREVRNYISMGMGFLIILLIILFDLIDTISLLMNDCNYYTNMLNDELGGTISPRKIEFFGKIFLNADFLYDTCLYLIISIVVVMIILKIYWSVKYQKKDEENKDK